MEKETGKEFAAKIIDLSNDSNGIGEEGKTMLEATLQEIQILRMVAGHPYIGLNFTIFFLILSPRSFVLLY